MAACIANGDPYDGIPPPFTSICRVYTRYSAGTGFFVGERRHIITARHVVFRNDESREPESEIIIGWVYTGSAFLFHVPAKVVCDDWRTDLALLRLEDATLLPRPLSESTLSILAPAPTMLRDRVYFEGFRHVDMSGDVFRRVHGRVAHAYYASPGGLQQRILTLDVTSWPGSSGSPVFSRPGQVVGVITAGLRATNEAVFRDARWILQLLRTAQGEPAPRSLEPVARFPKPTTVFVPFPVLPEIPSRRASFGETLTGWSQRLSKLLSSTRSQKRLTA